MASRRQFAIMIGYGLLAFEMFRVKHNLDALEAADAGDIVGLSGLFADMSAVEAVLYREVVNQRLGMIRKF